jgi:hypothetical protein
MLEVFFLRVRRKLYLNKEKEKYKDIMGILFLDREIFSVVIDLSPTLKYLRTGTRWATTLVIELSAVGTGVSTFPADISESITLTSMLKLSTADRKCMFRAVGTLGEIGIDYLRQNGW